MLQEAERLRELRHPNVPTLFGICLPPGQGVVLMEHCEGETMSQLPAVSLRGIAGHPLLTTPAASNLLHVP